MLSDKEVARIASAVAIQMQHDTGLTVEEIQEIRPLLRAIRKAKDTAGNVIVTAIVAGLLALLIAGFKIKWSH